MLLLTSNKAKYESLLNDADQIGLTVVEHNFDFSEIQTEKFEELLLDKYMKVKSAFGRECLVDDVQLLLEAYPGFPGSATKQIIGQLGASGLASLTLQNQRASMECAIAGEIGGKYIFIKSTVPGRLDFSRHVAHSKMPLSDWFIPDANSNYEPLEHRRQVLRLLGDKVGLSQPSAKQETEEAAEKYCQIKECYFCNELAGDENSIYRQMVGDYLPPSRVLIKTDYFHVMPPLGEFLEGGLLIVSDRHVLSAAWFHEFEFLELELLLKDVGDLIWSCYEKPLLIFEHGPGGTGQKGCHCVDHAHFNIFPVKISLLDDLKHLPQAEIKNLGQLRHLRHNSDYIFVQHNDGKRNVYFLKENISQYIRKLITKRSGFPERGHWMDYPGFTEIKATLEKLSEEIEKRNKRTRDLYQNLDLKSIAARWDNKAFAWDVLTSAANSHFNINGGYIKFHEVALETILELKTTNIVADLGCGTGQLITALSPFFKESHGLDISPNMIRVAQSRNLPGVHFHLGNIFQTPYPFAQADLLVSRGVLLSHYGPQHIGTILGLVWSALKPGATALLDFILADQNDIAGGKFLIQAEMLLAKAEAIGFSWAGIIEKTKNDRTPIIKLKK